MSEPYVTITMTGVPIGKGRPRARIVKPAYKPAFITMYSDPETEKYERRLAWEAKLAMSHLQVLDEPLGVTVDAFVPIPQAWSRREKDGALSGRICPGKPDADNYLKLVDALNGIVWRDDSLIVRAVVTKQYSGEPRLVVSVYRWLR